MRLLRVKKFLSLASLSDCCVCIITLLSLWYQFNCVYYLVQHNCCFFLLYLHPPFRHHHQSVIIRRAFVTHFYLHFSIISCAFARILWRTTHIFIDERMRDEDLQTSHKKKVAAAQNSNKINFISIDVGKEKDVRSFMAVIKEQGTQFVAGN